MCDNFHTSITFKNETKEFDCIEDIHKFFIEKLKEPLISITINGETKTFGDLRMAESFAFVKVAQQEQENNKIVADTIYKEGANTIWDVRFVFKHKFDIWVAKSKQSKYNVRELKNYTWEPLVFNKKKMMGLTGKELIAFYDRYVKVSMLR